MALLQGFIRVLLFAVVFIVCSCLVLFWCIFVSCLFLVLDYYSYLCGRRNKEGFPMARIRQPKKVKEPVRLRMKDLSGKYKVT